MENAPSVPFWFTLLVAMFGTGVATSTIGGLVRMHLEKKNRWLLQKYSLYADVLHQSATVQTAIFEIGLFMDHVLHDESPEWSVYRNLPIEDIINKLVQAHEKLVVLMGAVDLLAEDATKKAANTFLYEAAESARYTAVENYQLYRAKPDDEEFEGVDPEMHNHSRLMVELGEKLETCFRQELGVDPRESRMSSMRGRAIKPLRRRSGKEAV